MSKIKKKISLALQGSGTHGAFTWGVLDKFLESELFEIEAISGTSSGGMNAAALIQGFVENGKEGAQDLLNAFWQRISEINYVNPYTIPPIFNEIATKHSLEHNMFYQALANLKDIFSPYQINPNNQNSLRDLINEFFDIPKLQSFNKIKLFLSATHIKSGRLKIFRLNEISTDVILATACLPTLFHAVEIENEYYWDGGFVGNPAIYPLIYEADCKDIIVVQMTPQYRSQIPYTASEIANRHQEITYNACLMREMRAITLITKMIDQGKINPETTKRLNMHLIKNDAFFEKLDMNSCFNTDKKFLFELYKAGYQTATDWIKENYENIGIKGTANLEERFSDFDPNF